MYRLLSRSPKCNVGRFLASSRNNVIISRLKSVADPHDIQDNTSDSASTAVNLPDRNDYSRKGCNARRAWVESVTKTSLTSLDGWWDPHIPYQESHLKGNIESPVGLIKIPTGIIGPINIRGKYAQGSFLVPAATTEGAVVATSTRGCKAINDSGGAVVTAFQQHVQRSPVIICGNTEQARSLGEWIRQSFPKLHDVVRTVSKRALLKDVRIHVDNELLHLTFAYETGEAAGQNMVTVSTKACTDWILENARADLPLLNVSRIFEESTLSGDKRISPLSPVFGRGVSVTAKVSISEVILKSVMKADSEGMVCFTNIAKDVTLKSGVPQFNLSLSNIVAAVFAATGQDLGCVGECSQAFLDVTQAHSPEGGITATLQMPNVLVGTVGGGTGLPTQRQCLDMMSCSGPKSNYKLAEIIASVCLATELSTAAAQVSGDQARSLDKLGRNRPQ